MTTQVKEPVSASALIDLLIDYGFEQTAKLYQCSEKEYASGIDKISDVSEFYGRAKAAYDIADRFGFKPAVDLGIKARMKMDGIGPFKES